jgi:hypothetical protein
MSGSPVLVVLLVSMALTAWFSVAFVVPWSLRSLFRYRLWALRDQVMDEVLAGEVSREDALRVLERIEFTIRNARDLTALRLLGLHLATRSFPRVEEPVFDDPRVRKHNHKLAELVVNHVMWGSPSGWIASVFGTVFLFVGYVILPRLRRSDRRDGFSERVLEEVEAASEAWRARRDSRRELIPL